MNIRDVDLNLLHVFQAVHAQRNVSRAAEQLELSQPAVSHALTRLRLLLKDPLFVRAPGGVAPTAKADQFARQVEQAMKLLDVAIHEADVFDPARSQRRFAVHMSDIGADEFLPQIMAAVDRVAPGVRVEAVQLPPGQVQTALEDGRIDLAFGYLPELTGTENARLLDERYVVLLRRGHPLAGALKDRAALERLGFILVKSHAEPARALHMLGLQPCIRLTLPHFMVAPSILATTDLAVIMPSRPAARFAARHDLQVVEPALGLPPFTVSLHWNWRFHNDPGNRWLREIAFGMRFGAVLAGARRPSGRLRHLTPQGEASAQQTPPPTAASTSPAAASRTRARSAR